MVPKGDGTSQILPGVLQHKLLTLQTCGNLLMEMMQAAQSLQLNNPASALLLPLSLLILIFPQITGHASVYKTVSNISCYCFVSSAVLCILVTARKIEELNLLLKGGWIFFPITALMQSCFHHLRTLACWYEACLLSSHRHPMSSRCLGQ